MSVKTYPTGDEPALQLLILPRIADKPMRAYAKEASFLPTVHCRLCAELDDASGTPVFAHRPQTTQETQEVEQADACGIAAFACDLESKETIVKGASEDELNDVCPVEPAACDLDEDDGPDSEHGADGAGREGAGGETSSSDDDCKLLDPTLRQHVHEAHAMTAQQYRSEVFGRVVAEWPESISPQVLRTRLTAYKQFLCNDNLAVSPCACCARLKKNAGMREIVFPEADAPTAPDWLGWSANEWKRYGRHWWLSFYSILI